ncbi:Transmembrane protein [Hirschfeldia incana]|nr:Transmembrane protein [Hirschfeldia incana]
METSAYPFEYPTPSDTRRRWWWSRPIVTLPAPGDRDATSKECAAFLSPLWGGILTATAIFLYFLFTDAADPHPKFSIQSIAISPSSATYHVHFLVRNPSSRYSIYYDDRDASVRFGHVNVAVFNIIRERSYRDHTAFTLAFDAGEVINGTDVELHIKLRGMHERYIDYDEAGHFDITCQIRSKENIEKINCHSCFTHLRMLFKEW